MDESIDNYPVRILLRDRTRIDVRLHDFCPMTVADYRQVEHELLAQDGRQYSPHGVMGEWVRRHAAAQGYDILSVFVDNKARILD